MERRRWSGQHDGAPSLLDNIARSFSRSGGGTELTAEEALDDALMGDVPDIVRTPEAQFMADGAADILRGLETEYADILREKEQMALPPERGEWDFRIETGDQRPACFASRKLAPDGMRELSEQIQTMVRLGMARPSSSP